MQYVLVQGAQTFSMTMLREQQGANVTGVKMQENTFASNPAARRVLELIERDLKGASVSTPRTSTGRSSQALALRPQDLTNGEQPSLVGCVEKQYSACPVLDDGSVTETVAPCADLIEFYNTWTAQTANTCAICDQTGDATPCQVCANFEDISDQYLEASNKCTAENPAQCCPTGELVEEESSDPCSPPSECWETCGCNYNE